MPLRTAALIGAVCLTVGWLLASLLTPPIALVQGLPARSVQPAPADVAAIAPLAEQLDFKLRHAPQAPAPRRNPFTFGTRTRSAAPSTPTRVPAPVDDTPVAPAIVGPMFSLSGIGVREMPSGPVHTAVLSDGNTVHLVKAGDTIGGYQVIDVTETSTTLADAAGTRYVLRLR